MADESISQLSVYTAYHSDDEWEVLDTHDTSMSPAGTNKRVTFASFVSLAGLVTVGGASIAESQVTGLTADLAAKATDSLVVHLAGSETITGSKTFSTVPTWPAQAANQVFAGPSSGAATAPTFRALAAADLPTVTYAKIQNVAAVSLLGNPTGSAAAPSEITLAPTLAFVGSTLRSRVPLVWVIAPGTAVANSTALTSLFAGSTLGGSLTIPAGTLGVGSMLRFELFGVCSAVNPVTLTIQLLLGGVIIGQGTTGAMATITGNAWSFEAVAGVGYQVQAIGASGKVIGFQRFDAIGGGQATLNASGVANGASSQVTINTTPSLALDVKVQWSSASASDSIQLLGGAIYLDF